MNLEFLLSSSVVAVLLVQALKTLYGEMSKRFGSLISQLTLLAVSFCLAGVGAFFQFLPPQVIQMTGIIFASGVAVYEVFYKAIFQQVIMGN